MNIQYKTGKELFESMGEWALIGKIKNDKEFAFIEHDGRLFVFNDEETQLLRKGGKFVFSVLINSDMIEGRGPMVPHRAFGSLEKAIDYVLSQEGVFGSSQHMRTAVGVNVRAEPYAYSSFNWFDIKLTLIEDDVEPELVGEDKTETHHVEPDQALLVSMAMRYNHSFGLMDEHQQGNVLILMRQLWEEVVGAGFYKPEKRDMYNSMLNKGEFDSFDELVKAGKAEARSAMVKFPQPNYVMTKLAEEAGEVVGGCIKYIEGRKDVDHVRMEMKQLIAMMYRLWHEGDGVHGCPPIVQDQD